MIGEGFNEFKDLQVDDYKEILKDPNKRGLLMGYYLSKREKLATQRREADAEHNRKLSDILIEQRDVLLIRQALESLKNDGFFL